MSEQAQVACKILGHLSDIDVPHALIGGLAVSARTEPRFTQDLDLVVAVDDDAGAEAVVYELIKRGYSTVALIEHQARDRLGTARLEQAQPPVDGQVIDLLFASSGIEREIAASADRIQLFQGVTVPVARTGHLIALKVLARDDERRPQDLFDLRALMDVADVLVTTLVPTRAGLGGFPARTWVSTKVMFASSTSITTCAAPATGSGTSVAVRTSGGPNSFISTARMAVTLSSGRLSERFIPLNLTE